MVLRITLAAVTVALTLSGCAQRTSSQVQDYATGSSLVTVSHVTSRTDDGSLIMVTLDGKDAEPLTGGETAELHVTPGKHKLGGYVSTLLGYGRVTIQPIDVTAEQGQIKHVTYSVLKNKPTFTEIAPSRVADNSQKPAETAPKESSQASGGSSAATSSTTTASATPSDSITEKSSAATTNTGATADTSSTSTTSAKNTAEATVQTTSTTGS